MVSVFSDIWSVKRHFHVNVRIQCNISQIVLRTCRRHQQNEWILIKHQWKINKQAPTEDRKAIVWKKKTWINPWTCYKWIKSAVRTRRTFARRTAWIHYVLKCIRNLLVYFFFMPTVHLRLLVLICTVQCLYYLTPILAYDRTVCVKIVFVCRYKWRIHDCRASGMIVKHSIEK